MKKWFDVPFHPNRRVLTKLPTYSDDSAVIYFDRLTNAFWREDRSVNGPSSWSYWQLPEKRKKKEKNENI